MRAKPPDLLEKARHLAREAEFGFFDGPGTLQGVFVPVRQGVRIMIIASDGKIAVDGERWEHVSVSTMKRVPTWDEMCWVKDLFWEPHEAVMQLHPPKDRWISNHRYCLHLWRPVDGPIPLPPSVMVGVRDEGELRTDEEAEAAARRFIEANPGIAHHAVRLPRR